MTARLSSLFLALFLAVFAVAACASERVTPVVTAVRKASGAVVNIRAEAQREGIFRDPFLDDFFNTEGKKSLNLGTGVIIRNDGVIITNFHVVKSSTSIYVVTPDEKTYKARVIGGDSLLDIAVIKVDNLNYRFALPVLGNSADIQTGETVIAIGNPYGLSSSVTTGVVSNTKRILRLSNEFSIFIQTDALINPGNSGGPLINLDGEIIGINSAMYKEAQGIGFAIPIDTIKRVVPEILQHQYVRRGYLGFSLTGGGASQKGQGLFISAVAGGSDADRLGIKQGDYLTRLDDIPVSGAQSVNYILRTFPPGQSIKVSYSKQGREIGGFIKLSEHPKNFGIDMLKYNYKIDVGETEGSIIVRSSGYPNHIRQGDMLVAMNGKAVNSLSQLDTLLANSAYERLVLTVSRDRRAFEVTLTP
ncbi:hypothetical protein RsTz2092_03790 [Deferribacterales bacterium RsTz2092]|nr:hypothetical protein AGMMS49941_02410 [Deferribacterales bacterium]